MSKRTDLARLAQAARQHAELERNYGSEHVPVDPTKATERAKKIRATRAAARVTAQQSAKVATTAPPPPPPPPPKPPADTSPNALKLEAIRKEMREHCQCPLRENNLVFSDGSANADLMFIGEAPGEQEDQQGLPFVDRAGQLLTKIIEAMGFARQDVYITNMCKFRPPENRYPSPEEVAACMPFLRQQIEIIHPKIIVTLGNLSTQTIMQTTSGITKLRGTFGKYADTDILIMPTFHPAYLLRDPTKKKETWLDMQIVHAKLKEMGCRVGELKTTKA